MIENLCVDVFFGWWDTASKVGNLSTSFREVPFSVDMSPIIMIYAPGNLFRLPLQQYKCRDKPL